MSDDPAARMQAQAAQDQAQKDQARARQHAESAERANAERPGDKTAPAYDHSNLKDLYQVKLDSRAGETRQATQDAKQGDKPPENKAQEHGLSRDRSPATEAHPESSHRTTRPGDRSAPDHSKLGELPKLRYLQWPKDQVTTSPEKLPELGLGLEWPKNQVTTSRASDAGRIQDSDRKMERIAGTRPDHEAPDHGGPFVEQTPIQQLNDALKDISAHAQDNGDKAADFLDICRRVEQLYVRQDHGAQGSTYVIRSAELHEAGFSPQDISALDKAFRANGFAPEGQQRADYAIEPADPSQSWLYRGLTEEEADHQVAANAAGKEARKWNQVAEIVWGLATAAAGIAEARGSRPGPEPERAPTYEPHIGAYKPAAPEYGGLLPYREGEQQEAQSARMAGEPELAKDPTLVGDLGRGWDYGESSTGPKNWDPSLPPDTPSPDGKHPDWREVRERCWKRLAYLELQARSEGLVAQRDPGLFDLKPMAGMDDDSLHKTLITGKAPAGLELEHRIPQRVVGYLEAAGVETNRARRLGHLGDPANLMIVPRELHAAFDAYAQFGRNPSLPAPLDDRREFPFRSMTDKQLEEVTKTIQGLGIHLETSEAEHAARARLRDLLDAERAQRRPEAP